MKNNVTSIQSIEGIESLKHWTSDERVKRPPFLSGIFFGIFMSLNIPASLVGSLPGTGVQWRRVAMIAMLWLLQWIEQKLALEITRAQGVSQYEL